MRRILYTVILVLLLFSCNNDSFNEVKLYRDILNKDLSSILHSGKITVLFGNNASSYFEYKGTEMGFEYEILQQFCKDHHLMLTAKQVDSQDDMFNRLNNGEVDLVAGNLTVTNHRKKEVDFTQAIYYTHQVLVQRKKDSSNHTPFLTDATQLAKKKVNVWSNSAYYQKLKNIQNEIGDTIYINGEQGDFSVDYLIEQVADGTIDYTIADKNIASINQFYWNNIDISLDLSFTQKIAFALRKNNPELKKELDSWLRNFEKTDKYAYLKYKYFELPYTARIALNSSDSHERGTIIKSIKSLTKELPISWELVAAIIHRESRFNPNIIGIGGAYGLFQFMPITGRAFNVFPNSPIEEQLKGGIKLIKYYYNLWKDIHSEENRIKFALASYNAGPTHVYDAIELAKRNHLNPYVWDKNVAIMFINLSSPDYYNQPFIKSGATMGSHTVNYVADVYNKFIEYKN